MTPHVSAIVVSHRSAGEAAQCVASLQRAFEEEGIRGEVVLVDCGSGDGEAPLLRAIPATRHLLLEENRGYSGGVNAGLAQARAGSLLLANADVVFAPGAVTALLGAIGDRKTGVAAPLSVWDSEARLRLPPGYAPGLFRDFAQLLSGRFPAFDDRRFASFARDARRLWERGGRARHLSGAVLAARRDVFDAAGRFDERFPFEYEETEWEDRVRSRGYDLVFVPGARVRHLWAVSASRNPQATERRRASESLYRRRRYGRLGEAILERAARLGPRASGVTRLSEPRVPARSGAAVAISPNPSGIPFAAADLSVDFRLPDEVAIGLPAGPWYFTVFRTADGHPIERFLWRKEAA
jgi:N-acetylglucosaminyl-diphospho-decaprenol L-rhamnosyltransferase